MALDTSWPRVPILAEPKSGKFPALQWDRPPPWTDTGLPPASPSWISSSNNHGNSPTPQTWSDHFWIQPLQLSLQQHEPQEQPRHWEGPTPGVRAAAKGLFGMAREGARTRLGLIPAVFKACGAGSEFSKQQAQVSVQGCAHRDRDTATSVQPGMCTRAGMCRKFLPRVSSPHFCPTSNLGIFSILQKQENLTRSQVPVPGSAAGGGTHRVCPHPAELSSSQTNSHMPAVTLKDLGDVSVGDSPDTPHTLL